MNPTVIAFGQPLLKSPLSCGQGRSGADNAVASRLLQFLGSLLKVLINVEVTVRIPVQFDRASPHCHLPGTHGQDKP
jgi:hypothetical protein